MKRLRDPVARQAQEQPGRTALIRGERTWSYAELDADTAQVAGALRNHGVRAGDRVALLLRGSPLHVLLIHALPRLGASAVLLDPRLTAAERHPLLALDKLSAVCDEAIFVESAVLDDFSPYRGGHGHGYPGGQLVMEFYPTNEYGANETNWWVPTGHCLAAMVHAAGFPRIEVQLLTDKPKELAHCRGFVQGYRPA